MITKFQKISVIFKTKYFSYFNKNFFCSNKLEKLKEDINKLDKAEKVEKVEKQQEKIENFYSFMEDNMNKYEKKNPCKNPLTNEQTQNNSNNPSLINFVKCPMTNSDLEITEEGLKVAHIVYPKRHGIYILVEEEAQFKF